MIYLDNASTTQIDDEVFDTMLPYLKEKYGNAGNLYTLGRLSKNAIDIAREQVANLIGASSDQIIFTSGGSEANNLVFSGVARELYKRQRYGLVVSAIEHDSVLRARESICFHPDLFSNRWSIIPDANGHIGIKNFAHLLMEMPDFFDHEAGLMSIMHTNNETGVTNSVKDIAEMCHGRGILFHTDCVQGVSCHRINVNDIGCDFLSLSSHKIHGPKGVGALYVRDRSLLEPLIYGGHEQEFGLRGGTENVAGIVGFGKACDILDGRLENDMEYFDTLIEKLYNNIYSGLQKHGLGAIIYRNGKEASHTKVLNLRFDGVDGETLLLALDARGVCVSAGSACRSHESEPSHVLIAMGIHPEYARNSIRFSVSRMNTVEEIEEAAQIVVDTVLMLLNK